MSAWGRPGVRVVLDGRTISDHFPGIGRYTFNLAGALAQALPADDELLVLHNPAQTNTRFDLAALAAHPSLRLVPTDVPNFALREQWLLPALLRRLGADVYHSPYYWMPFRPGCPTLLTLHDLIPMRCPRDYSAGARLAFALAIRLAVNAARRVISVSRSGAADLQLLLHVAPERVVTIPEASDPIFRPQPPGAVAVAEARSRYDLPPDYVLYFGSNKPHKNLVRLVRAYTRLEPSPDLPPLVIGGHWDQRFPEAQREAEASGAARRVLFIGPVEQSHLPALYSGARLFVFPSVYEGFGLPPLEALACGVPVACSNASSLPEVVGDAALTFDPLDEAAIGDALAHGLKDPALRADLRARGLARAALFTWTRAAQQTLDAYHSLAQ
jgi:glycosyltransferase involved in cell wall biosynthesis